MSTEPEKRNNTTHQLRILAVCNQCMCALTVVAKTKNTQELTFKNASSIRLIECAPGQKRNHSRLHMYVEGKGEQRKERVILRTGR